MKRIDGIRDLEPYGIDGLTGESDAHLYRILCDVTARGKAIVERTMDVRLTLHENWNRGSAGDPHVGSLLLPFEFVPSIAVFCLLSDPVITEVWLLKDGPVLGFEPEDADLRQRLRAQHEGGVRHVFRPRSQDRNVHQMSGRST